MSILGSLLSIAAPIVGGFIGGPAGFAIGTQVGAAIAPRPKARPVQQFSPTIPLPSFVGGALPVLATPTRGMRLPTVPRAPGGPPGLPGLPIPIPGFGGGGGGACPAGFHLDKRSRSFCVRNRRMNPLNGKAASRAIRRIKGARKMLQKIERQLPKQKARRTPAHGHRVHVEAT